MDIKKILNKMKEYLLVFWQWIKPYLSQIHAFRKRIWKKYQINKIILLVGMICVLITSVYLFYLAKSQNVDMLKEGLQRTTVVYDKDDDKAGELRGQKGTFVGLDKISPNVVDALISTEDRRFYSHRGYDIKGILRGVLGKVTTGKITGGGSTLTQQLAKNAYLDLDQTLTRKAKELFLSIEIEKTYTKDEILEMYLNNVYMANGVWGIEDASHRYFGKSAAELTKGEAATLVGMLKGPEYYNPINNYDRAIARRNVVLDTMVTTGKLTQAEDDELSKSNLTLIDNYNDSTNSYTYAYYFDSILDEVERETKISVEDIQNKGYKVYTYLDQNYQKGMDTAYSNSTLFPPNAADGEMVQSASVAINPKTGGVSGVVGGRGEKKYRDLNRATQSSLSPGSTMKPLAVFTPALEAGYTADSLLKDEKLSFYNVENYDRTYKGEVTLQYALEQSLNVSTVWLMKKIGLDTSFKKVEKFGISLDDEDHYYGMGLGGLTKGTTPLKMASAYTVFANDGQRIPARFIRKIEDASGAIVYENESPKATSVTSKKVADDMTSLLMGVYSNGTGVSAKPYNYTIAGKTGTTENVLSTGSSKDQWMIGYTPDVVLATWIGFDQASESHYLTGSSSQNLSQLFKTEMENILVNSPNTPFEVKDVNDNGFKVPEIIKGFTDKVKDRVKEETDGFGSKIKERANDVKDQLSSWLNSLFN